MSDAEGEPHMVIVVGQGGEARSHKFGVSVAGLGSDKKHPRSTAISGQYGVSVGAYNGTAFAKTGAGGIAASGKSISASEEGLAIAEAGGGGIAVVNDGGRATAGDGGIAMGRGPNGKAHAGLWGTAQCNSVGSAALAEFQGNALVQEGTATAEMYGLASVRRKGKGQVGPGGVVILWNHASGIPPAIVEPYPEIGTPPREEGVDRRKGSAAAGTGGVIIAFFEDPETGERKPIIGFVGDAQHDALRVQTGLSANIAYRVSAGGKLVPVARSGAKGGRPSRRTRKRRRV